MKWRCQIRHLPVILALLICASGTAAAEPDWPPFAKDIGEEFVVHRHRLESFEARMQDESLTEVTVVGTWEAIGYRMVDGELQFETLENGDQWVEDLFPLRIDNVERTSGGFAYSRFEPLMDGEIPFEIVFFHGELDGLFPCAAPFATAECGFCGVTSSEGWSTIYRWTPPELSVRNMDILDEENVEEASARFNKKHSTCMREGYDKIALLAGPSSAEPE